jgi:hypothetical protein
MDATTLIFGLFLLVISTVLVFAHLRVWRAEQSFPEADEYREFAWRKFRRRMQASIMIGIAGVAILASAWLPDKPLVQLTYWAAVVILVAWIALLACADLLATRHYFGQAQLDHVVEHARLRAQLRRHQHEGNGHDRVKSEPARRRDTRQ